MVARQCSKQIRTERKLLYAESSFPKIDTFSLRNSEFSLNAEQMAKVVSSKDAKFPFSTLKLRLACFPLTHVSTLMVSSALAQSQGKRMQR